MWPCLPGEIGQRKSGRTDCGSRINSPSAHRSAIFLWCEDKTIEMFLRFRCLDLNTRRWWKISIIWWHTLHDLSLLNLNLRNHSELSIVILRLLNFILNFRSWVDKSPHHFESELGIIPHLKIASNKRMSHCPAAFTLLGYYSNSICQVNPFLWRQGELWSFGIDCYSLKSIFIKIRIMLSFPCCQKLNRVAASQPALY